MVLLWKLVDLAYIVVATAGIAIIVASELMTVSKGILLFVWVAACVFAPAHARFRRYFNDR